MNKRIAYHWPWLLLFSFSICVSLGTFRDYGVSWDEGDQRSIGLLNANYMLHDDPALSKSRDRDHGAGFELILIGIEKAFHLEDPHDIYLARHIATHLFILLAACFSYLLGWRLFRSRWLACLAFILFLYHPRMYGHSWFNSKDLPTSAMFLISFTLSEWAFRKQKIIPFILLGIASGFTSSIRLTGLFLPLFICLLLMVDIVNALRRKQGVMPIVINCLSYLVATFVALYAFWPAIWAHPYQELVGSFGNLAHFVRFDADVLLNGKNCPSGHLPWFYLPEWFCITTPLPWLLAGFIGIVWLLIFTVHRPGAYLSNTTERQFLLYLLCFVGPVAAVFVVHPVLYDDWRHFYFIYPSFVFLLLFGIAKMAVGKYKKWLQAVFAVQLMAVGVTLFQLHPFPHVYFNMLIPNKPEFIRKHFEQDYWGTSMKEGLAYIVAHDTSARIPVKVTSTPLILNYYFLPPDLRSRILLIDDDHPARYRLTFFRLETGDLDYPIFFEIRRQGSAILRVYKTGQ